MVRIDCASVSLDELYDPMAGGLRLVAARDCTVHGFALWFDVDFYGRAALSTAPTAGLRHISKVNRVSILRFRVWEFMGLGFGV